MKAPAQKRPPRALKNTNRPSGIRTMPASGGAIVLNPGMNLATIKERGPCLEKMFWVSRTHESGSSEMRQSQPRTLAPPSRPTTYQTMSAMSEAMPDRIRSSARLSLPVPAAAPAASRNGIAGIGMPICSARTEPKTTRYPYRTSTPIVLSMSVPPLVWMHAEVHLLQAPVERIGECDDGRLVERCERADLDRAQFAPLSA